MSHPGKLYLVPVPISESTLDGIPHSNLSIVRTLKTFIAEDARTARRHLKEFAYPDIREAEILTLNEHSEPGEIASYGKRLAEGLVAGLMSEAGCPGIADPGAEVVKLAHRAGVEVIPLVGPSAIVLSIMASGFNGQNFAFTGYLPLERGARVKRIRELEQIAGRQRQAQFFIETPYRNEQLFSLLLEVLDANTLLFVGRGIMSASQLMRSKRVAEWRSGTMPPMHREPAVFGIFK